MVESANFFSPRLSFQGKRRQKSTYNVEACTCICWLSQFFFLWATKKTGNLSTGHTDGKFARHQRSIGGA